MKTNQNLRGLGEKNNTNCHSRCLPHGQTEISSAFLQGGSFRPKPSGMTFKEDSLNSPGVRLALQGLQRVLWSLGNGGAWKMLKRVQHDKLMRGYSGFTLIELLVVVLIIGILASVALPQYQLAVAKSRVMRLLPLMKSVESAQEVYKLENGEYAGDFNLLTIEMPAGANEDSTARQVNYADFTCGIGNSSTTKDSLYCSDSHYEVNLERYYASHTYCWAVGDRFSEKLCRAVCASDLEEAYGVKRCTF